MTWHIRLSEECAVTLLRELPAQYRASKVTGIEEGDIRPAHFGAAQPSAASCAGWRRVPPTWCFHRPRITG